MGLIGFTFEIVVDIAVIVNKNIDAVHHKSL